MVFDEKTGLRTKNLSLVTQKRSVGLLHQRRDVRSADTGARKVRLPPCHRSADLAHLRDGVAFFQAELRALR